MRDWVSGNAAFRSVYNALVPQARHLSVRQQRWEPTKPAFILCLEIWDYFLHWVDWVSSPFWLARAATDLKLFLRMKRMKSEFDLSLLLYAFAVSRLQHSLTVPLAVLSRPSALWVPEMLCPLCRQALRTGSQNVYSLYSLYSLYSYHFAFRIKLRFERQIGREVWVDDAGVALMHEWSQPLNQNTVLWGIPLIYSFCILLLKSCCVEELTYVMSWAMRHILPARDSASKLHCVNLKYCSLLQRHFRHPEYCATRAHADDRRCMLYMLSIPTPIAWTSRGCIPVLFASSTAWKYRDTSWWLSGNLQWCLESLGQSTHAFCWGETSMQHQHAAENARDRLGRRTCYKH